MNQLRSEHFDVAAMDLLDAQCSMAAVHEFGIPIVGWCPNSPVGILLESTPMTSPPTHIPQYQTGYVDKMDFWERLNNLFTKLNYKILDGLTILYCDYLIREYLPHSPSIGSINGNLSGMLINHSDVWEIPRAYPRNIVNILGMHMYKKQKPLTKSLADFIDGAKHGVVLFSMGHTTDSENSRFLIKALKALGRLPQRVIMKMPSMPGISVPKNILALEKIPLTDVMAHPNVKVYVTHGGINSLHEAIKFRTPIVGIPSHSDNMDNLIRLINKNASVLCCTPDKMTEQKLYDAIVEARDSLKIYEGINSLADLVALERHEPMDNAVYLMEYVAKTQGSEHFKLGSRHLNGYQYYGADIVAFGLLLHVAFSFWTVIYILPKIISFGIGLKHKMKID
jgi:2-hydroxyacylsphingosine 1-beta-galactosyltransferase